MKPFKPLESFKINFTDGRLWIWSRICFRIDKVPLHSLIYCYFYRIRTYLLLWWGQNKKASQASSFDLSVGSRWDQTGCAPPLLPPLQLELQQIFCYCPCKPNKPWRLVGSEGLLSSSLHQFSQNQNHKPGFTAVCSVNHSAHSACCTWSWTYHLGKKALHRVLTGWSACSFCHTSLSFWTF